MTNFENMSLRAEQEGWKPKNFDILVEGNWKPEDIGVSFCEANSSLKRTSGSENVIEEGWNTAVRNGFKEWPNDRNPSKYRLADFNVDKGGKLNLVLDPGISYRDYIGSRSLHFVENFGTDYLPNPIGVNTVIIVHDKKGDEYMLLTLRSDVHDYKAGGYQTGAGGFMETTKDQSPVDTAIRETCEESGVFKSELVNLTCRGIVMEMGAYSNNIVFSATTTLTLEDIIARREELAGEKGLLVEESENNLLFIPTDRRKLQQWMFAPTHAVSGSSLASILLVGKEIIGRQVDQGGKPLDGDTWMQEMMHAIAWRTQNEDPDKVKELEERDVGRLKRKVGAYRATKGDNIFTN